MFVLREIVENKLYAIETNGGSDIFNECFKNWQSPLFVFNFFKGKEQVLEFYQVTKKEAASLILEESKQFYLDILALANGEKENAASLDYAIFVPLHTNDDFNMPLLETKAYGKNAGKSFLRLYAIRLKDGCYIVVGGLIKTSKAIQDTKEGKVILSRIRELAKYLRVNKLYDAFDIAIFII